MNYRHIYLVFFIGLIWSCKEAPIKKQKSTAPTFKSAFDVDDRLNTIDSLVVVFYKDPFGSDSLRYTRFFTQVSVIGSSEIQLLKNQLAIQPTREEKHRNCRGEGKIWCYSKSKIFQTLYFSTRGDGCLHVYLIKDGFFYYLPIQLPFIDWLRTIKPLSKDPQNMDTP